MGQDAALEVAPELVLDVGWHPVAQGVAFRRRRRRGPGRASSPSFSNRPSLRLSRQSEEERVRPCDPADSRQPSLPTARTSPSRTRPRQPRAIPVPADAGRADRSEPPLRHILILGCFAGFPHPNVHSLSGSGMGSAAASALAPSQSGGQVNRSLSAGSVEGLGCLGLRRGNSFRGWRHNRRAKRPEEAKAAFHGVERCRWGNPRGGSGQHRSRRCVWFNYLHAGWWKGR